MALFYFILALFFSKTRGFFPLNKAACHEPGFLPSKQMVELIGFEPTASCLQSRRSTN
jgi:hypothetical protein